MLQMRFRFIYAIFLSIFCLDSCKANSLVPTTVGDGQCIWYDVCVRNPHKIFFKLNCKYDGPAKSLPRKYVPKLEELCPELYEEIKESNGRVKTCCSGKQIEMLERQLQQMAPMVQNCPACYSNLKRNFCYFTCHPRHSSFMRPTEYYEYKKHFKKHWAVQSVEQFSSYTLINQIYASCEHVYLPAISGPALDFLCGFYGHEDCSPEKLFNYFGDNFLSPFVVTYQYGNENTTALNISDNSILSMTPLNLEITPCNTTDPDLHCVCQDCPESCKDPPLPPQPKDKPNIIGINIYNFVLLAMYCLFVIAFVLYAHIKGLPGNERKSTNICTFNHKISALFEESLQTWFRKLSEVVAHHPYLTLTLGAIAIGILTSGISKLKMTTDPVKLWASPDSRTRYEKNYFDKNFGPFYRTNQIIITPIGFEPFNYSFKMGDDKIYNLTLGPVFNATFMKAVMDFQLQIMDLLGEYNGTNITMNDICIKPLFPQKDECMIQSVMNYWQNDPVELESQMFDKDGKESFKYIEHLKMCLNNPTYMSNNKTCLGTYGGPVFPYVALGGFLKEKQTLNENPLYENATALIITILGQNYLDPSKLGPALAWEKTFLDLMKNFSNPMMDFAFYSERGVEDEIIRESKGDLTTILISYLVMFTYVTISLGQPSADCNRMFIETKMTLGLSSVILVFLSVTSSIGLCSFLGVEGTLFVIEVIPFLLLAIGVDNIYLLVQTWQRKERRSEETVEEHLARCVGKVAPSMLLATTSEAICFFLGALSQMPAVHAFSIFAGVATSIGFILQMTCLVALMVLDAKRLKENRYDVMCCVKGSKKLKGKKVNRNMCLSFFDQIYAPFLFKDIVRVVVVIIFVGYFFLSAAFIPRVNIGLEQDIGMPSDSFIIKYFQYLGDYLSVGTPVYFVVEEGYDFTNIEEQNLVCQSKGCRDDSILAQIYWSSRAPDVTYIATGANNWLDAYLQWINDGVKSGKASEACCRLDWNENFINTSEPNANNARRTCLKKGDFVRNSNRPQPKYFMKHLSDFLIDNPHGTLCSQAGHPSYGTSVVVKNEDCEGMSTCVGANNFMAYHSILKTSADFTKGLYEAYKLSDQLNEYLKNNSQSSNARIFPYSIFYVYYEQYLTMWATTAKGIGISLLTVFLVMIALSGLDVCSSSINLIIIIMIVTDIIGVMVFWNIQLNAISLVNLVMAVGISVEFCNHITHAFAFYSGSHIERASQALVYTGSSVLSGITMTKFGGIIVLAFATSNVITIFYFRMYLLIVLFGSVHGLVFLPVLLSLIGPASNNYAKPEEVTDLEEPKEKKTSERYVNAGFCEH